MSLADPPCKRILLVEDHQDTADLVQLLLGSVRHEVTVANSAEAALQALNRQKFDLLLCDIGLPVVNGLELMRQVRQQYSLPAVAMSGYGTERDRLACREAGFNAHILKPVDIQELVQTIHRVCVEN